jgi:hypothetical protein
MSVVIFMSPLQGQTTCRHFVIVAGTLVIRVFFSPFVFIVCRIHVHMFFLVGWWWLSHT